METMNIFSGEDVTKKEFGKIYNWNTTLNYKNKEWFLMFLMDILITLSESTALQYLTM